MIYGFAENKKAFNAGIAPKALKVKIYCNILKLK